jgi:isopenicillin N synthase-like dioxygenase
MTSPIPVVDLAAATAADAPEELLATVKEATETVGIIQVVNHGISEHLIGEFDRRIGRLLSLPRSPWREGKRSGADLAENSAGR